MVVAAQRQLLAGLPLGDGERSGPAGLLCVVDVLTLVVDDADARGELGEQPRVGFAKPQHQRAVAVRLHVGQRGQFVAADILLGDDLLQGPYGVGRGDRGAVGERRAAAQVEAVGGAVFGHLPRGGERRLDLVVVIALQQRLIDVAEKDAVERIVVGCPDIQ